MTKYPKAKVYNIAFSEDFLSVFSKHLLEQNFSYSDIVLLPTRRACRKLERYFFANKSALILPQLLTYSDIANNAYTFLDSCPNLDITLPKAITKTELYFIVWQILKKVNIDISYTDELLGFINKFYTFADSAEQIKDSFVYRLLQELEAELKSRNFILEQTLRKIMSKRIIDTFTESTQKIHLVLPVEIIPHTRNLILHLANFSNVSIYLQGLDLNIANEAWDTVDASHPQWPNKDFLTAINLPTEDVVNLGSPSNESFVSNLMLPNQHVDKWRHLSNITPHVYPIRCEDLYQEATIISYIVRDHLENGSKAIAIFSDDTFFNKLLKQKFSRWKIIANDTNEIAFTNSIEANFLLLCSELLLDKSPVKLLEILKHPLSNFNTIDWLKFETTYLRKPVITLDALHDFPDIRNWLTNLDKISGKSFSERLESLLEFIVSFSTISKEFIRELDDIHNVTFGNFITSRDFVSLLQRFISEKRIRNEEVAYDTVTITSFLEARLLKFDLVIVPQMNHPYPKQEVSKFFITSQLSSEIGLPKDEALSGYCHFDLSSHMTSKSFVTRSQKVSGKEEIPSLIFEKLQTLCSLLAQDSDQEKFFTWYKTQNYNQAIDPIDRPLPKPTGRPKRMSVSAIEKLMENPYGFYANYILGLKKLEPIEGQLSNREFGIATHDTIKNSHYTGEVSQEKFVQDFLNKFNQETLQYISAPEIKNFWIPRIQKIANWIWEYESNNANKITRISKEHKASFVLDDITVFAIPDRVEYMHGNAVKVVDYKTGQTPTVKDIEKGLYPQLPLEGLILQSQVGEKEFIFEYHNLKGKKESVELKKIKADMTKAEEGLKKLIATYLKGDEPFFAVCDESTLRKTRDYLHLSRVKEWFD